jgi:ubiquinone/menaquinone biosynthesis C-methylase UbiE
VDFLQATRAAYDQVAASYAEMCRDLLATSTWDRAALAAFAELVGPGPVGDLGCGPGRVTAHLHALGVDCFGIDLSPGMIEVARETYPGLRFDVGTLAALNLPDATLAGALSWYSIIHTPPEHLPEVFAEFHRVLAPGAPLLLAFQTGNERRHITQGYGHDVDFDAYRLPPEAIAAQLREAGFVPVATLIREPEATEKTPQAYLTYRKP